MELVVWCCGAGKGVKTTIPIPVRGFRLLGDKSRPSSHGEPAGGCNDDDDDDDGVEYTNDIFPWARFNFHGIWLHTWKLLEEK